MFCMQCGEKLPDHAKFCLKCGAKIDGTPSEPQMDSYAKAADSRSAKNLLARARDFERAGDHEKAEEYYSRVLDLDRNNAEAQKGYDRMIHTVTVPNLLVQRFDGSYFTTGVDVYLADKIKDGPVDTLKINVLQKKSFLLPANTYVACFRKTFSEPFTIDNKWTRITLSVKPGAFGKINLEISKYSEK